MRKWKLKKTAEETSKGDKGKRGRTYSFEELNAVFSSKSLSTFRGNNPLNEISEVNQSEQ